MLKQLGINAITLYNSGAFICQQLGIESPNRISNCPGLFGFSIGIKSYSKEIENTYVVWDNFAKRWEIFEVNNLSQVCEEYRMLNNL